MKIKFQRSQSLLKNSHACSFPYCLMTWKLQQSCSCSRDDTANKTENIYSLTPVINRDCVISGQIKVLLQYLLATMQTNNQRCVTQILLINTKGTVLCIINQPLRFCCSKITLPKDMVHSIKMIKVLKVSNLITLAVPSSHLNFRQTRSG